MSDAQAAAPKRASLEETKTRFSVEVCITTFGLGNVLRLFADLYGMPALNDVAAALIVPKSAQNRISPSGIYLGFLRHFTKSTPPASALRLAAEICYSRAKINMMQRSDGGKWLANGWTANGERLSAVARGMERGEEVSVKDAGMTISGPVA